MKKRNQPQINLFNELIVDNFAGGGGASTGIELATGRPVDIAINHDPAAILMHRANHPYTRHYREDVWKINPRKVCQGQQVGLAWFSPDCKHFSKAKGGKPRSKKIRGLAWVAMKWAGTVRPRVIILENVEEFQTWGPLDKDGNPIKKQVGRTFHSFINAFGYLGYKVEYRELRACDYGAPTIRKRFFLIARCDGKPIVWPEPTHGDPNSAEVRSGKLKPWRTAAEIIDWSLPCPSIFDSTAGIKAKYQLHAVRPLAENTMKRVARGIDKFVLKSQQPFIVQCNHSGNTFRGQNVNEPLQTVTGKHGYGVVKPVIEPWTVTNTTNATGNPVSEPIDTIRTGGGGGKMLMTPVMTDIGQTGFSDDRSYGVKQPVRTIVSKAEQCIVAPSLIQYHSETQTGEVRGQRADEILRTVDASNRYGLVSAMLTEIGYGDPEGRRIYSVNEKPLSTVVSKEKHAVVTSQLVQLNNHCIGQPETEPINTVTAGPGHFAESRAFLAKYYGTGEGQRIRDPLGTVTARDRFGLVMLKTEKLEPGTPCGHWPEIRDMLNRYCGYSLKDDEILIYVINGVEYIIMDIGLRMLTPRELYAAQGFPADYIIDVDCEGNAYPKSEQVARCGNAVPPPFAKVLVLANLPELCVKSCDSMAELRDTMAV